MAIKKAIFLIKFNGLRRFCNQWDDKHFVINGTISNVVHIEIANKALSSLKYWDTAIPVVIPSQNIIFQKLSLLSRALTQFIATYIFKIHKYIILLFNFVLKKIRKIGAVMVFLFIAPMLNAEDLKALISNIEKQYNIPQGLLYSIAIVESGVRPYVINVEGRTIPSNSEAAALETIKFYRDLGYTNIDIGVMQINYRWHVDKFANIDEMLNPVSNIKYAAKLLTNLYKTHGSWHKATRLYHSTTPKHHNKYSKRIILEWIKS